MRENSASAATATSGRGEGYGSGYGMGPPAAPDRILSVAEVRARFLCRLAWYGDRHLKIGEVKESVDDTIVADIVTLDDFLVQRFRVDRHTGRMQQAGPGRTLPEERDARWDPGPSATPMT